MAALELKESGQEYWPSSRKNTGRSTAARRSSTTSLAEYWPAATTRENFEEPEEELRESVDSNNYWVPSDNQSNYDKMG